MRLPDEILEHQKVDRDEMAFDRAGGGGAAAARNSREAAAGVWAEPAARQSALFFPQLGHLGS